MDGERMGRLFEHINLLNDMTVDRLYKYKQFTGKERPEIVVIAGDENLKAKAMEIFSISNERTFSFYSSADQKIEIEEIILSDFIIVYTAALKVCPLDLQIIINKLGKMNKALYVVLDKWNMLPRTADNIEMKIHEAYSAFAQCNINNVYAVYKNASGKLLDYNTLKAAIYSEVKALYGSTHERQAELLYSWYLDRVRDELDHIAIEARNEINKLEDYLQFVISKHNSSKIKFRNISAELNVFSNNLNDIIQAIRSYELKNLSDIDRNSDQPKMMAEKVKKNYIRHVNHKAESLIQEAIQGYHTGAEKFRNDCICEMASIVGSMEKLNFKKADNLARFHAAMEEFELIDNIIHDIEAELSQSFDTLKGKIKALVSDVAEQEFASFLKKCKKDIFVNKIKNVVGSDDEEEYYDRTNTERDSENPISEEAWSEFLKGINIMISTSASKIFTEADIFAANLRKAIIRKSDNAVDTYYTRLEKEIHEMIGAVEKEYIK